MGWREDIRARFPDWETEPALARWASDRKHLSVGQRVHGEVMARAPFGVWVDIHVGHPAVLLVPEMSGARERQISFEEFPMIGEPIEARIRALGQRAEIGLSQHYDQNA